MLDVNRILQSGGILVAALIIFAETGLLIGFFLPGDTLLIAAGILAGEGKLSILWLLPALALAAFLGYEVGYKIGAAAGPRFFKRQDGLLFREEYLNRTSHFFKKHGAKTILLIRFVAVARTIIPLMAGMGKMSRRSFRLYNVVGSILWTFSITLAAYWLGRKVPNLDKYIVYLLVFAAIVTAGGVFIEIGRSPKRRAAFKEAIKEEFRYLFRR